jgi:ketosteroid isomerase-like protein
MPAESHVDLVRRFIERWNSDDHDGMMELVEEDIDVVTSPRWPMGPWRGRQEFGAGLQEWRAPWERIEITLSQTEVQDDRVAVGARWSGQGGASGVALELAFGVLLQMDGGKIVRMEFFEEPEDAFDAFGR